MVLKEETADVVSFRESARGADAKGSGGSGPRRRKKSVRSGWVGERAVRALSVQRRVRAGECDESIDK